MNLTRLLADASATVNQIAHAPGVDRDTRASALSALNQQITAHVRRLCDEQEAANARVVGLNPVSQVEGS